MRTRRLFAWSAAGFRKTPGLARRVFGALEDVPLRMISYGGSPNNISLLINTIDKARALRSLNGIFSVKE